MFDPREIDPGAIGWRQGLKYAGLGVLGLVVVIVLGVALGVLGAPTVDGIENRFAAVNDTTTTINSTIAVGNPNPVGVDLGGLSIDYAISMNDVAMAAGDKQGLDVESGASDVSLTTRMNNTRIPAWWYTHVSNDETTTVFVDVAISHGLLGGNELSLPQEQTVSTDILGQFNDSTTRPINANRPLVSDPVLYVNETSATYGENLTRERTPLDMAFTVYNPKPYPYTVSEIGYTIEMNGVAVGSGSTQDPYAIPGGAIRTLEARTVIRNQHLDEWWVSHLERDQVTNLTIDFYLLVDPDAADVLGESVEPIRLDVEQLDHETTIETDVFGTKASDGLHAAGSGSGSSDGNGATDGADDGEQPTPSDGETTTATPTETPTETDVLPDPTDGDSTTTEEPTATATETATTTPTRTATATATETTDDGSLLG